MSSSKASMTRPYLRGMIHAILDKRLYGYPFFLSSGPLLAVGISIEILIEYILNRMMLFFYIPLFIALILISGIASKNYGREVPNMGHFRGFLFLIASVLAATTPFLIKNQNLYNFSLLLIISTIALIIAIVEITVYGQRVSLRNSIQLTDDFIKNKKKIWKKKLEGFPSSEKIINSVEEGRFVKSLFDKGSFNLTILWSCNVMEKIVDIVTDQIISKDPEKKALFRKEGNRLGYPKKLENLGFKPNIENNRKDEQITLKVLWDIRNDIAHANYKPTFQETSGAICLLVNFMNEMPQVLQSWNPKNTTTKTTIT